MASRAMEAASRPFQRDKSVPLGEFGILLPNNQRQHRSMHIQKNVLPCALC